MATATQGVWAIDIGANSLKAVRMRQGQDGLEVTGFDYVEHSQMLSAGNLSEEQKQEIVAATIHQFVQRNSTGADEVAVSIAGQSCFVRFVKLPPVEQKGILKVVQYEAVQQIPFDINEVEWDWQLMGDPNSQNKEVGIFAIKNDVISSILDHCSRENMRVSCVQISPIALYNYLLYDQNNFGKDGKTTVILDMGTESTTLVACTKNGLWQRTIRIGGNTFTEAIADAFNLKFQKAEKLKRNAAMSKHMRQLFGAMRPVFTDFGSEVQRSLGFYTSGAKNATVSKLIVLGGGMRLQGIAKYLQQSLSIPVVKPDSFERLTFSQDVSSAKFHANVADFAVVYGLGAQLLDDVVIKTNLLPRNIARMMAWTRKAKLFTIAAGILLVVSILGLVKATLDKSQYNSDDNIRIRRAVKTVAAAGQKAQNDLKKEKARNSKLGSAIKKQMDVFKYRDVVPLLNQAILSCLPNADNNAQQGQLYKAFEAADPATVMSFPRSQRKQLFITGLTVTYAPKLTEASLEKPTKGKGIRRKKSDVGMDGMMPGMMPGMMMPGMMMPGMPGGGGKFSPNKFKRKFGKGGEEEDEDIKEGAGFVVFIEGYSPYRNIKELLEPAGVTADRSRWGFITRLIHLDKVIPGCRFELFAKNSSSHFKYKSGDVIIGDDEMPVIVGIREEIERVSKELEKPEASSRGSTRRTVGERADRIEVEEVLIDPLTGEETSRVVDIWTQDEIDAGNAPEDARAGDIKFDPLTGKKEYIMRDTWFRIQAKFLWKNAPDSKNETDKSANKKPRTKRKKTRLKRKK